MSQLIDLTNQRFERLLVIQCLGKIRNTKHIYWQCKCDCGNVTEVTSHSLRSGTSKSCGCIKRERNALHAGQKFGRLTIVKSLGSKTKKPRIYWLCQCECGNTTEANTTDLKGGKVKSCGCLKKDYTASVTHNLTGQKFNMWTVLHRINTEKKDASYWFCVCDCGTQRTVKGYVLTSGKSKSCGCIKTINEDLTGRKVGRLTVLEFLKDIKKDRKYAWKCLCDCGNEFVATSSELVNNNIQSCGCIGKEKARIAVEKARAVAFGGGTNIADITKRGLRVDNKTGVRGVVKRGSRFRALIGFKKKKYNLGTFDTLEEAIEARKKAEAEMYDTFLEQWHIEKNQEKSSND